MHRHLEGLGFSLYDGFLRLTSGQSLATGRPVTFTKSVIDCEFPDDTDADLGGPDNPDCKRISLSD